MFAGPGAHQVVREAKRRHTPALPRFPPLRPCYRPLADALFSQALWRILRSVLRTSLAHASSPAAGGAFVTDAVIDCALHLVGLAAAAADADAASGPGGGEAWARLGTLCNVRAHPSRTAPPHSALPPSTPRGA